MTIDIFTSVGAKKGSMELPSDLFGGAINHGLIHQALQMQKENARTPVAHVKVRGEVVGSTKKLFQQKHTGRARRGPIRSPLMRGGGKAFGPRNTINFERHMPRKMRHAAVRSCLAYQAKNGVILALEAFPEDRKTKTAFALLQKLPIAIGRPLLFVTAGAHAVLERSVRNIRNVKTVRASYVNPEDIVHARAIIFMQDAFEEARKIFAQEAVSDDGAPGKESEPGVKAPKVAVAKKKSPVKRAAAKKTPPKA